MDKATLFVLDFEPVGTVAEVGEGCGGVGASSGNGVTARTALSPSLLLEILVIVVVLEESFLVTDVVVAFVVGVIDFVVVTVDADNDDDFNREEKAEYPAALCWAAPHSTTSLLLPLSCSSSFPPLSTPSS